MYLLKIKCEQYWPDKIGEEVEYGELTVIMKTENVCEDYIIRIFEIASVCFQKSVLFNNRFVPLLFF